MDSGVYHVHHSLNVAIKNAAKFTVKLIIGIDIAL
jgi:hypothetical protein